MNDPSHLRRPTAPRAAFSLFAGLACLALGASSGCDNGPPKAIVAPEPPKTAESELERVIERLREALDAARTPSDSGVASKRTSAYRMLDAEPGQPPRAEVTIGHHVELLTNGDALNRQAQTTTTPAEIDQEETFELVYRDDRWRLDDKPETGLMQVCWEYALDE